ncbi:MAG: hypothetical protein M3198_18700 [Actinomycetota bacterium]|nr:hypothetical protein [Actinomycetota bacterium]
MGTNSTEPVRDDIEATIEATRQRIDTRLDELAEQVPPVEQLKNPAAAAVVGGAVAGVLGVWIRARLRDRRIRRIARQVVEEVERERAVDRS